MLRSCTNHKKFCKAKAVPRARIIIGNLKRENAFLLKTLNESARHYNDHNRIIEKFLALIAYRPSSQEFEEEGSNCGGEEQRGHEEHQSNGVNVRRLICYADEIEEIKDQLVNISARCQYLENNTVQEQESATDVQGENAMIKELQMSLNDAIEKNKRWIEYDQQREHYVKSIITRMSWLEKHLQEVSEAGVTERKEFLSDEKKKLKQIKEYYEGLMHKASQELDVLREHVCLIESALTEAQRECREKQCELDELKQQQLQRDRDTQKLAAIRRGDEEEYLPIEAEDLQVRLNKERRKSATLELQSGHLQKYFLNHYHKAQKQIAKFKRMIEILLQDLHDERENCSYLKQQLEHVQTQPEEKEATEKAPNSALPSDLPPLPPKTRPPLSPHKSVLDESLMECPMCHSTYPASQYSELIEHLDYCQM